MLASLVTLPLVSRTVSVYMLLPSESSLLLSLKLPMGMGAEGATEDDFDNEDGLNGKSVDWLDMSAPELLLYRLRSAGLGAIVIPSIALRAAEAAAVVVL